MINQKFKKMDIQAIVIILLIGLVAGILGGMVGIGGGIIIVPCLVYFLGMSQLNAQGTSLAMILLPVGILGVIEYHKQGYIDYKVVIILAAGFVIGTLFGSRISLSLPQETVKKFFAILMILIALKMLFLDKKKTSADVQSTTITKQGN